MSYQNRVKIDPSSNFIALLEKFIIMMIGQKI